MTSVSSMNSAAVLIVQQANPSTAAATASDQACAPDAILAAAMGVSGETGGARLQASSAIDNGLWDGKQNQDGFVQAALDYLDSDLFQSSDPRVKDTLKKLIAENGEEFAAMVQAEKGRNAGMTLENAIANAIGATIHDNRGEFSAGEFVVGFKFAGGGSINNNIADLDGNGTYQSMMDDFLCGAGRAPEREAERRDESLVRCRTWPCRSHFQRLDRKVAHELRVRPAGMIHRTSDPSGLRSYCGGEPPAADDGELLAMGAERPAGEAGGRRGSRSPR